MNKSFILIFFLFYAFISYGQTTRDVTSGSFIPKPVYQATKTKKENWVDKVFKGKKLSDEQQFRKDLQAKYREKARMARKMNKPQYTDPSYFGHKRPPKKRPPGKQKFCKECQLTH